MALHATTIRFGDRAYTAIALAADAQGISVSQYVREAASSARCSTSSTQTRRSTPRMTCSASPARSAASPRSSPQARPEPNPAAGPRRLAVHAGANRAGTTRRHPRPADGDRDRRGPSPALPHGGQEGQRWQTLRGVLPRTRQSVGALTSRAAFPPTASAFAIAWKEACRSRHATHSESTRLSHKPPTDPVRRSVMGRPMLSAGEDVPQVGREHRQSDESRYVSHQLGSEACRTPLCDSLDEVRESSWAPGSLSHSTLEQSRGVIAKPVNVGAAEIATLGCLVRDTKAYVRTGRGPPAGWRPWALSERRQCHGRPSRS